MWTKISKWGNSQGLRLSKDILDLAGFGVGEDVEITVRKDEIVLKKVKKLRYNIAELVAEIPPDYKASEVDFGPPVGREEW